MSHQGMERAAGLAAVLAAAIAALAAPAAAADPTPAAAIAELNLWRAQLGEAPVSATPVSAWDTGCQHHNNYEQQNGQLSHPESSSAPGYTADGAVAGPDSVLAEAVSLPQPTPDDSLLPGPVWDSAVFHRVALLQPRLANTGYNSTTFQSGSMFTSWTCMWIQNMPGDNPSLIPPTAIDNSITTPSLTLYPSPANGAYDVPTTFPAGTESPDPATEDNVPPGATLGWLLSVEINGPWNGNGQVYAHGVAATLAPDGTSNQVPLVVSECGATGCSGPGATKYGPYMRGGFGIFPTQALMANTTYRVTATGTVTGDAFSGYVGDHSFSIHWCFSTGASYTVSSDCSASTTGAGAEPIRYLAPPTPGAPKLTSSSLALGRKARLSISLSAGTSAPGLKSIRISAPKGISFSRKASKLRKGVVVTVAGKRVSFSVAGGATATITLATPGAHVKLAIGTPALALRKSLVKRHFAGTLKFVVKVTDGGGTATTFRPGFVFH